MSCVKESFWYYFCICVSRSVYVLYGSQTGNSESIAKDLNDKLESVDGFESCCMALNEAAKLDLKEEALAVVIGTFLTLIHALIL